MSKTKASSPVSNIQQDYERKSSMTSTNIKWFFENGGRMPKVKIPKEK